MHSEADIEVDVCVSPRVSLCFEAEGQKEVTPLSICFRATAYAGQAPGALVLDELTEQLQRSLCQRGQMLKYDLRTSETLGVGLLRIALDEYFNTLIFKREKPVLHLLDGFTA